MDGERRNIASYKLKVKVPEGRQLVAHRLSGRLRLFVPDGTCYVGADSLFYGIGRQEQSFVLQGRVLYLGMTLASRIHSCIAGRLLHRGLSLYCDMTRCVDAP